MRNGGEVEKPEEVISDHQNTRRHEGKRSQGDKWPSVREILKIDNVTKYRE